MSTPERQFSALLAGRLAVLSEHLDLAPARSRIGQQAARRQRHEQRAAEVVVAIDEGEPACRRDPAGYLPGAHRRAPEAEALSVAVRAPELSRPRISLAPSVDDAACLGILEVDVIAERHRLEGPDSATEAAGEDRDLADLALRPRYRTHVFVEDVGGSDDVTALGPHPGRGRRWRVWHLASQAGGRRDRALD